MLIQWLREHKQPTWHALAEAITSPTVGLSHLAQEIIEQNTELKVKETDS